VVQDSLQKESDFVSAGAVAQLALPLAHATAFAHADFVPSGANRDVRAWLARADWPENRIAIWGDEGTGKTHLMRIWAQQRGACLLDGGHLRESDLHDIAEARAGAVALDNADRIVSERALLHLLNSAREAGVPLMMAGRLPPARWDVALPDLGSRLRATVAVEIARPDEALLRVLLMRGLAERQIVVPQPVMEWLLRRIARSPATIRDVVDRLDRAALASGGGITRTLARQVLDDMPEGGLALADAFSGP